MTNRFPALARCRYTALAKCKSANGKSTLIGPISNQFSQITNRFPALVRCRYTALVKCRCANGKSTLIGPTSNQFSKMTNLFPALVRCRYTALAKCRCANSKQSYISIIILCVIIMFVRRCQSDSIIYRKRIQMKVCIFKCLIVMILYISHESSVCATLLRFVYSKFSSSSSSNEI